MGSRLGDSNILVYGVYILRFGVYICDIILCRVYGVGYVYSVSGPGGIECQLY